MRELFSPVVDRVFVLVRTLGPYAAIELLLPGGSMLALLYWWYRQRVSRTRAEPRLDTGSNLALDFRRGEP